MCRLPDKNCIAASAHNEADGRSRHARKAGLLKKLGRKIKFSHAARQRNAVRICKNGRGQTLYYPILIIIMGKKTNQASEISNHNCKISDFMFQNNY
jgi:hypothetical protein